MQKIRQPKQRRSIKTKQQITRAAFLLFAEKGIHGTNSKEIVAAAGVSIGSFYSYFKNKKTLLLEMLEEYLDRIYTSIWAPLSETTYENIGLLEIQTIVESAFSAYEIAPEFHRQTHALRYSDPEINFLYERERKREIAQNLRFLENNVTVRDRDELYATAIVLHNLVESAIHTYKFLGPQVDRELLIQQLSLMILSYFEMYQRNQAD